MFFKYILNCIEQDIFATQTLREHFSSFAKLIHIFVKEGFISDTQHTRLYYTFVLTLKDKLEREGGVKSVSFDDIISVIWTLVATEEEGTMNPLIPRLYERLHEFKRPEKPLTSEEMLMLH